MALVLQQKVANVVTYRPNTSGSYRSDGPFTVGGDFTVQVETKITGLSWATTLPATASKVVGIWGPSGLMAQATITALAKASFGAGVTLYPGYTYTIGVEVGKATQAESWRDAAAPQTAPYPFVIGTGRSIAGTFAKPTTGAAGWFTDMIIESSYFTYNSSEIPPEPFVTNTGRQFIVTLPKEWMPKTLREWDLQYQRSFDNTKFGDWIDIGTFPTVRVADGLDDDTEEDIYGVYTHNSLDVVPPLPFYRYRYKARTDLDETDWSEPAFGGQVKGTVDAADIEGTLPDTVLPDITGGLDGTTLTGVTIVNSTITSNSPSVTTLAGVFQGGTLSPNSLSTPTANIANLTGNVVTYSEGTFTNTVSAVTVNASSLVSAPTINASTQLTGGTINVTGLINGNTLSPGVFNGVSINNGIIDGTALLAKSVTADKMATGFIDANVSVASTIDASAIKGGLLSLGGKRQYNNFKNTAGGLQWPWRLGGTAITNNFVQHPENLSQPTGASLHYVAAWTSKARVDIQNSKTIGLSETFNLRFDIQDGGQNKIREITFDIVSNLPGTGAAFTLELVDQAGNARPAAVPYSVGTTAVTTVTKNFNSDGIGLPSGIGLQLRCTTAGTVPAAGTFYFELSNVSITMEKGSGRMEVFDDASRLRAEVTANYIRFKKASPDTSGYLRSNLIADPDSTFIADSGGVWVPSNSLTIGSTAVPNLTYNLRDLSGSLVINPRFEIVRVIADPTDNTKLAQIPTNWIFLSNQAGSWANEGAFTAKDGVYPQWQSLVSGQVLQGTLKSGATTSSYIRAVSQKAYVQPDSLNGLPKLPLSISTFFRTAVNATDITVKISLYMHPTSSADVMSVPESGSTLLGQVTSTGSIITSETDGAGQILFRQIKKQYLDTPTMIMDSPGYVYVVLEAVPNSTLGADRIIEWDNVDLAIAQTSTPSDNQQVTDLSRRVTTIQDIFLYMLTGTKAILPEITTGTQGLQMVVVT